MTREDALCLIRMTMFEFQRDVMIPLNSNNLYDKTTHSEAVRLNEEFSGFLDAIEDLYEEMSESSAEIERMDYFQISQLLSLCRDISELYNLPVYDMMPDFIPDDSPIKYVAPDVQNVFGNSFAPSWMSGLNKEFFEMAENGINHPLGLIQYDSHLNKFFLTPINTNQNLNTISNLLRNSLNALYSNLDQTYDIYENIKKNLSTVNEYISGAELAVNFITGTLEILPFLNTLLPYFSDAKSQVDKLLQNIDALNFERLGNDLSYRSLADIFKDIANEVRALLSTTTNKLDTLPEHDSDILITETTENRTWWEKTSSAIRTGFTVIGNGLSWFVDFLIETYSIGEDFTCKIIPPEADWTLPDGRLSASTGGITFYHLLSQNLDATGRIEVRFGDNPNFLIETRVNHKGKNVKSNIAGIFNVSNDDVNLVLDWSTLFKVSDNTSVGTNMTATPFSTSNRMFNVESVTEGGITSFRINWTNLLKMSVFIRIRF
jgi:hypothetical protein